MHYLIFFLCFTFQTTNCGDREWLSDPNYFKVVPSKENPYEAIVQVHPESFDRYLDAAFKRAKDPTHSQVVTIGATSWFDENVKKPVVRRISRIETFTRTAEEKQHIKKSIAAFEQKFHSLEERDEVDSGFVTSAAPEKKERKRKAIDTALETSKQITDPAACELQPFTCHEGNCNRTFDTYNQLTWHCSSDHQKTKLKKPLTCSCPGRKKPRTFSYNSLAHNGRCVEINKQLDMKNRRDQETKKKKREKKEQ